MPPQHLGHTRHPTSDPAFPLVQHAPWYGPVWHEACRFEQRCNHLDESLAIAEYGLQQLPRALPAMAEAVLFHQSALPVLVVGGSLSNHPLLDHVRTKYIPSLAILGARGRMVQEAYPALKDAAGEEQAVFLMQDSVLGEKITSIEKLQEMLEQ